MPRPFDGDAPVPGRPREYRKLLRGFCKYYRGHLRYLCVSMGTMLVSTGATMLIPLLTYKIFDEYLKAEDMTLVTVASLVLLVLALFLAAAEFVNIYWGHKLGIRMETDMRADMFAHLQKLSFSYFDRNKTGHIMSRLTNDLNQISELAHHGPETLTRSVLTIAGSFGIMLYLNWQLTLITVLPLPLLILWGGMFQGRMHRGFRDVRKKIADINSQVENSIQGIREVKSFTNEENEIGRFRDVNRNFLRAREAVYLTMAYFHSGTTMMMQSYSLIYVIGGAVLMYFHRATLLDVMTFMMYSRYFTMPIFQLSDYMEQIQMGYAAYERFAEVMDEVPDIADAPGAVDTGTLKGEIRAAGVYFRYSQNPAPEGTPPSDEGTPDLEAADQNGRSLLLSRQQAAASAEGWVLENINLQIPAGTTVAMVGESGAGKTTLAALFPRFYETAKGEITIDGVPVKQYSQRFLRSQIGIVRQTPFIFDTTIAENIRFGRPGATDDEVAEAAKNANIYDFIMSLPQGFATQVGEQGVRLSGGQRQRLSIARVFLKNPAILIFDEATSALDNESEMLVRESMERLCSGRTTVIIAHRLSTIRNAGHIYCLRDGRVVEEGTHAQLAAIPGGYYKKLYEMHKF